MNKKNETLFDMRLRDFVKKAKWKLDFDNYYFLLKGDMQYFIQYKPDHYFYISGLLREHLFSNTDHSLDYVVKQLLKATHAEEKEIILYIRAHFRGGEKQKTPRE